MSALTAKAGLTGKRILVVEDEYYLATEVQAEIERAGGTVVGPCPRLDASLALLAEDRVDAAIVDINLGHGPSFDLADALRASGVPFVFLTGYDATSIPDRFSDVPCIQKPADVARLLEKLKQCLSN